MIQDIVDLLVIYLRRKHYSILSKRCRDKYFLKYGVLVPDLDIARSDLLVNYRINFITAEKLSGLYQLVFLEKYSEYEQKKILGNFLTFTSTNNYSCHVFDLFTRFPNVAKFNVVIAFNYRSVDVEKRLTELEILSKTRNLNDLGIGFAFLYVDSSVVKFRDRIVKLGCRILGTAEMFDEYGVLDDILTEAEKIDNEQKTYPELKIIYNRFIPHDLMIRAPKLERINSQSLVDTHKLVQRYPTIKKISPIFRIDESTFEDDRFILAYTALRNFDFDLKFTNGIVFPKKHFDTLMDLELRLSDFDNFDNVKSRFYRSIEAIVDFVPSKKHWDLFDLYGVTTVLLD